MIILDTNVVSELMRPAPSAPVVLWLDRQSSAALYLTTLTVAELRFGVAAIPDGRRRTELSSRFEEGLLPLFSRRVLAFDEPASRCYATLRSSMRAAGRGIGAMDALIAAIAMSHRFEVASRDVSPFTAAGLRVINPFEQGEGFA